MTTSVSDASTNPYSFRNDEPTAAEMLGGLGQMVDPFSTQRLLVAGVRPGIRCLEVGAGTGSIATWLADQVGPTGSVIATDIQPQHIPERANMVVLEHNVLTDPVPDGPFDVIHARAVLQHLPQRLAVLARLADRLAPGGALVVEEFEPNWGAAVLAAGEPEAYEIFGRYGAALVKTLHSNGANTGWCRQVFSAMRDIGLSDVSTEGWQRSWAGGTGVCLLAYSGSRELRPKLLEAGLSEQDVDAVGRLAMDPRTVLRGLLLLSTVGRRPRD